MKNAQEISQEIQTDGSAPPGERQSVGEVARALEVHPSDLQRWRRELREHGERVFNGAGKKRDEDSRVAEWKRKVGQQAMKIDFLKRALQHVEEQRLVQAPPKGARSTSRWKRSEHGDPA